MRTEGVEVGIRVRCPYCGQLLPLVTAEMGMFGEPGRLKIKEHEKETALPVRFNHCTGSGWVVGKNGALEPHYAGLAA